MIFTSSTSPSQPQPLVFIFSARVLARVWWKSPPSSKGLFLPFACWAGFLSNAIKRQPRLRLRDSRE
jgi:hypothetical protein